MLSRWAVVGALVGVGVWGGCPLDPCGDLACEHGSCDSETGACVCDEGWTGSACHEEVEGDPCEGVDCGVHGSCNADSGACVCEEGWQGDLCDVEVLDPCGDLACEHGSCQSETGACVCDEGWTGVACSEPVQLDPCAAVDCGAHGTCEPSSGACVCDEGWGGEACDLEGRTPCTGVDCGAHGSCVIETGACACDEGWSGALCDAPVVEPVPLATLDDLPLFEESAFNGSARGRGFISGGADFVNNYNAEWSSWDGFVYSADTDTTTPGYANQYSAITGGGHAGSPVYGVATSMMDTAELYLTDPGDAGAELAGLWVTNTTYAYLSMRDGDAFAKKFGGIEGTDADWFKLVISGIYASGATAHDPVEFYLADYRADIPTEDYILDDWAWVDLSPLGAVIGLHFTLDSSDVGDFGMNTPASFALDDVTAQAGPPVGLITDFEDLPLGDPPYWNGATKGHGFISGGGDFVNNYNADWASWDGFALSNVTDTETRGFGNQYAAIAGAGQGGSPNYAVGYDASGMGMEPPTLLFPGAPEEGQIISGLYVCNDTYTYYSMLEGDAFAKKFGGEDGSEPDWLKLRVEGIYAEGANIEAPVDFYLADFRSTESGEDYILSDWTWVDLSSLGAVIGLKLSLSSSDVGDFGMNTPAYFAIDSVMLRGR